MKRRWKIAIGLLAALAVLLAVNTGITDSQTKEAAVTAESGQILELSRGAVQVTDSGEPADASGQAVVLIHGYASSLHWFDRIEPLLAQEHRVIRIDLLGFGGSEKPESGYEIPAQAAAVAEAMNRLGVQGALVAGHSMGGAVTASLAEQASQLVDRAVLIDRAPNNDDYGDGASTLRELSYLPVLGEGMWRVTPDFVVRDGFEDAVAEGFDLDEGFDEPDQPVRDFRAMTYTSYDESSAAIGDYVDELALDERFKRIPVPLLVIFGAEDQKYDAAAAIEGFADVPGVRTEIVEDAGHSPQVEKPEEVAALLEGFSVDPVTDERRKARERDCPAGERRCPNASDRPASPNRRGDRPNRNRRRSDARRGGGRAERGPRQERRRRQNR